MTTEVSGRGARVILVPPPVYFAVSFAAGMALHAATDDHLRGGPLTVWLGAALLAAGLALDLGAVVMFVRSHTTIVPHHRVAELVTGGPYRLSRNPMYTGLALITAGVALLIGTWWPLVTLIPALVIIRCVVIGPEERYLAEAFGEDYAAYSSRVRRWL